MVDDLVCGGDAARMTCEVEQDLQWNGCDFWADREPNVGKAVNGSVEKSRFFVNNSLEIKMVFPYLCRPFLKDDFGNERIGSSVG